MSNQLIPKVEHCIYIYIYIFFLWKVNKNNKINCYLFFNYLHNSDNYLTNIEIHLCKIHPNIEYSKE